jgi:putative flippase GtrA
MMRQFIKFNLVGLLNTALDFAVFTLLTWLGVYYILAQCLSYGVGMLNSYTLNKYWTFAQKGRFEPKQAIRFALLNLGSLLLSLALLVIFKDQWMMKVLLAKLLTTVITTLVNYAGNKLWVFPANETKYS